MTTSHSEVTICAEEVARQGELEPCDKTAVALRVDADGGKSYPVCIYHTRRPMVPLDGIRRQ